MEESGMTFAISALVGPSAFAGRLQCYLVLSVAGVTRIQWVVCSQVVRCTGTTTCRDEFTVKIWHSSFCDPKIELRSSWCDLCSSFLVCFGEKIMLNSVTLSQLNQSRELNILKKKKIVLPLQQ